MTPVKVVFVTTLWTFLNISQAMTGFGGFWVRGQGVWHTIVPCFFLMDLHYCISYVRLSFTWLKAELSTLCSSTSGHKLPGSWLVFVSKVVLFAGRRCPCAVHLLRRSSEVDPYVNSALTRCSDSLTASWVQIQRKVVVCGDGACGKHAVMLFTSHFTRVPAFKGKTSLLNVFTRGLFTQV
jgi:hypothetical protein